MTMKHLKYVVPAILVLIVVMLRSGAPVATGLPLGLILLCPLMMIFMMQGMSPTWRASSPRQSHRVGTAR